LLWPHSWIAMIVKLLRQEPCPLSTQDLLALGSAALNMSAMDMAYLASAAGLGRTESPAMTARFLLLRAKSLNQPWQRRRTVQCLRAALELARQAHDETLLRDVFATIDGYPSVRRMLAYLGNAQGLEEPVLRAVLHKERQATGCPRTSSGLEAYVVAGVTENFGGVFGPYADAYQDSDIDDEDDDDEYDEDDEFDEDDFGVDEFGNDYDEDEDDENDPGLFDLDSPARAYDLPRDGPSPQDLAQIARELENKGINSPEQVMADPMALIEAMAKAMGQTLTPAQKREMVEKMDELLGNIPGSPPPGFFDGESKKKKRKRRGRS